MGYAAICLIFEKLTAAWEYDEDNPTIPSLSLPWRDWKELTGFSPQKFKNFVEVCQYDAFISIHEEGKLLRIEIPILLKWRDEYTGKKMRKSGQSSDNVRPKFALQQQKETEEEKIQNNTKTPLSPSAEKAARKVLWKHNIDPNSARGEYCLDYVAQKAKDNPAGYLVGTLKSDPHFGLEESTPSSYERGNGPQHVADIIKQISIKRIAK